MTGREASGGRGHQDSAKTLNERGRQNGVGGISGRDWIEETHETEVSWEQTMMSGTYSENGRGANNTYRTKEGGRRRRGRIQFGWINNVKIWKKQVWTAENGRQLQKI